MPDKVTIELSGVQALVLYEFLRRSDDEGTYSFIDTAEQRAIWDLEIALQPPQDIVCSEHYGTMLHSARAEVRAREE